MNCVNLNIDCLLEVICQSALIKQLHLRLVCNQWADLIEYELHRRKSVSIFASLEDYNEYKGQPMISHFAANDVLFLQKHKLANGNKMYLEEPILSPFAKLTKLIICPYQSDFCQVELTDTFLTQLPATLDTIALEAFHRSIWPLLPRLSKLKRLKLRELGRLSILSLNYHTETEEEAFKVVFNRLESLETTQVNITTVTSFGSNILHLKVDKFVLDHRFLDTNSVPTSSALTHLYINELCSYDGPFTATIDLICSSFPSLASFHLLDKYLYYKDAFPAGPLKIRTRKCSDRLSLTDLGLPVECILLALSSDWFF